ncbi:META domain-containing protein [Pseudoalteromonas sp. MMG010]|uniref:META domain-containing protein n=1 Tax=Pseudoalteromonas sp. MMG010 TaxID=2822685 RepID=UPI001B3A3220|nr:META domain-containing protein [Pseudoalteromonas sp. MMG010]MBQ4834264.1 META domain-containing protein [Pseudoalteromonas sp. MMG010]
MANQHRLLSNKNTLYSLSLAALSLLTLSACDQQNTATSAQSATQHATSLMTQVTYNERQMLRPGSQLIVTLSDVSKTDVKSEVIVQQILDITQAPPYTVELIYDENKIDSKHRYNLSARIINKDKVLYKSTTAHNPFNETQLSTPHTIELERMNDTQKPDVSLYNTYFKAITLQGDSVTVLKKEPFIQFDKDNRVHGFLGCNNFTGRYDINQQTLTFNQLASTKKMCSQNMQQEQAMLNALNNTQHWQINGETLIIKDHNQQAQASFNAVYLN